MTEGSLQWTADDDTLADDITQTLYEQALEDDEPWAVDTHEQRGKVADLESAGPNPSFGLGGR